MPPSKVTRATASWIQIHVLADVPGVRRFDGARSGASAAAIRASVSAYECAHIAVRPAGYRVPASAKSSLSREIYGAAVAAGDVCGKWVLFVPPAHADDAWRRVAGAVEKGELGESAKVAPCGGMGPKETALICVYCADFADRAECERVLRGIKALGLRVTAAFKADALTYAGSDGARMPPLRLSTSWQLHTDLLHEVFPPGDGAEGFDLSLLKLAWQ